MRAGVVASAERRAVLDDVLPAPRPRQDVVDVQHSTRPASLAPSLRPLEHGCAEERQGRGLALRSGADAAERLAAEEGGERFTILPRSAVS